MTNLNTIVNGKAYRFADANAAAQLGNGLTFFGSADELASAELIKTSDMVAAYNTLAEKPVTKFSDRKTAANRTWAVISDKVPVTEKKVYNMNDINTAVTEAATKTKLSAEEKKEIAEAKAAAKANEKAEKAAAKADAKAAKEAAAAAKKAEGGASGRGRVSALSGMILKHKIVKNAEGEIKNPRKAGSHGWKSLGIIIDAGDAGISTEGYLAAGGRMNDLHWEIDHGNVVTE